MSPDYAQRRRVAVALAITVIVAPAAVLLNRGGDAAEPTTTMVGTVPPVGDDAASAPPAADGEPSAGDVMGTPPVAFLEGSDHEGSDEPATIAIPRVPQSISGNGTFSNGITRVDQCRVTGVPFNAVVTVTNLDNSRSVQCFASIGGPEPDHMVVMHTDAFSQIADLTDAPIPVRVTW